MNDQPNETRIHNNTYARRFAFLPRLLFILLILVLTAFYAVQFTYAEESDSVNLYLDVGFNDNLLMNKYDVSLELDGEQLGTVEYGKYYTKLCNVKPGKHVLSVYKTEDSEVMGEHSFQVKEDETFQCKLKTKKKEIEVEDAKNLKGTAGHSMEVPDCVGLHLVGAEILLDQKGFVNHHPKENTEETIEEETWVVDAQNFKVGEKIDKNDEIILTCIPGEEYVDKTFPGLSYNDAIKKAKAIGYKKIQRVDSRRKTKEGKAVRLKASTVSDEAKPYWTVKAAKDKYSDDATLTLSFSYNPPMPDLTGVIVKSAEDQVKLIRQGHFYYSFIGYKSGDPVSPENLEKYEVLEQSQEPGTIIEYKSTITFKCKKTEAAKEAERKAEEAAKAEAERKAQEELESKLNVEVWYTRTGNCYHLENCSALNNPLGPVTQREAIKMGLGPCSKCIKNWFFIPNWTDYR